MAHESDISPTDLVCANCGYNLTGAVIGGLCAECGTPVRETLRRQPQLKSCGSAITSMVLGIISLLVCGLLGPVAIVFYFEAMKEINRGGCTSGSKAMATSGLVMGSIALLLTLGVLALWIVRGL